MGRKGAASDPSTGRGRLAGARSAYLRAAADQAIDWHPWGAEAFETARSLGRPVLLDIGAAWCHWCHVMDEGTYSDPEVARLLTDRFVAVKVDRDEHPEVDRRYQRQIGALTGEGGWPLTGFLTPDGEAFLGGTYFPVEDHGGRPGMRRLLREVDRLWQSEPDRIRETTAAVAEAIRRMQAPDGRPGRAGAGGRLIAEVRERLDGAFDPVYAGFGQAPKFPHPVAISFLLWDGFARGEDRPVARARETLRRMAEGGLYDQLGGGFHRYAVDEAWHIPHFEKMGIDNAALLATYEEGFRRFAEPRFEEVARGTAGFLLDVLGDPSGGFGASQDADNAPGDDGAYFTWTRGEIEAAIGPEEARLVRQYFGIGSEGRMPHAPDRHVLFRAAELDEVANGLGLARPEAAERLARALDRLRVERARRPAPAVDRAQYASLNGPILGSLARAGRTLGAPELVEAARSAADLGLAQGLSSDSGMAHRIDGAGEARFGRLEDNAGFASGLVELAGATADPRYAQAAGRLLALIDRAFRTETGLCTDLAPSLYDGPRIGALGERYDPVEDSPNLSPNATVALALIRFGALTGELGPGGPLDRARTLLEGIVPRLRGGGLFASGAALAFGLLATPPARVVVTGTGPGAETLARAAETSWHPNLWVFRGRPPEPFSLPEEIAAARDGPGPRALLCLGTRCLAPITDPTELVGAIRAADRPHR